jgi:outer membrane biosynthesis protein TonB
MHQSPSQYHSERSVESPFQRSRIVFIAIVFSFTLFSCSKQPEQKTETPTTEQANEQTSKPTNEQTKTIDPTTLADTVELTTLKQWPAPTKQIPPVFPEHARMNGIKAEVMLKVLIGIDGKPRAANVQWVKTNSIYDSTNVEMYREYEEQFKQPSIDAVMLWEFTQPLKPNGEPANVWVNVPLQYNLTR